jgi:CTP synthase (UTP-ammonia lyase)
MKTIHIALVGDYDPEVVAHRAIPKALGLAALSLGRTVDPGWVGTEEVEADPEATLGLADAVWCVPASPYRSTEGALTAIRRARMRGLPFLGTCGGFQHAVIEFARDVCGIAAAAHAESDPEAGTLVVTPLACALREVGARVNFLDDSRLRGIYGPGEVEEEYMCGFGLNPEFRPVLEEHGMRFTGFDAEGAPRAFELAGHPFFVGTLFQPERAALKGRTPPLVRAFVHAAGTAAEAGAGG